MGCQHTASGRGVGEKEGALPRAYPQNMCADGWLGSRELVQFDDSTHLYTEESKPKGLKNKEKQGNFYNNIFDCRADGIP